MRVRGTRQVPGHHSERDGDEQAEAAGQRQPSRGDQRLPGSHSGADHALHSVELHSDKLFTRSERTSVAIARERLPRWISQSSAPSPSIR